MKKCINNDSRFFEGFIWVSKKPNGMSGLCFETQDPEEAVRRFFRSSLNWHNRGCTFVAFAHVSHDAEPVRVEVTVSGVKPT